MTAHQEHPAPASDPSAPGSPARSSARRPRWLADEMVGRLARYLRFMGYDTAYVRGLGDREVAELVHREARVLLTRDRDLSRRVLGSLLLASPQIAEQVRAVHRAYPMLTFAVRFDRCSLCNGELRPTDPVRHALPVPDVVEPSDSRPRFECVACGHRYWEGSHTDRVRRDIAAWVAEEAP